MSSLWPERSHTTFRYISQPPSAAFRRQWPRRIAILGSTGSIGKNALAVAENAPLRPVALAAGRNIQLLAKQANRWRPDFLACIDSEHADALRPLLNYSPAILWGAPGYAALASLEQADCVVSAQVGAAGLMGTLAAAKAGKVIALANKESLVIAGALVRRLCAESGASILPVDSEHYAIFQCLAGHPQQEIKKLVLTASGGPFLGKSRAETDAATPALALRHPNWNMGAKISIDSATLMNKGLEFIEAMQLYGADASQIEVVIHPQSIIHSLVEFQDNSLLAQLAAPDMRLPIASCLSWPLAERPFIKSLDLTQTAALTFFKPDLETFPCLDLAIAAATQSPPPDWQKAGLNPACIMLNAANEAAVEMFLHGKCLFGQIHTIIAHVLHHLAPGPLPAPQTDCYEAILALDQRARAAAMGNV